MAAFQAKIGWKRLRKREYKNYNSITQVGKGKEREILKIIVPFCFYSSCNRNYNKIAKKFKNFKKMPLWLQFKPKQDGKGREREKIKFIVPFRSYPTGQRKFKKKKQKILKNLKYDYGIISNQNRLEKAEKER